MDTNNNTASAFVATLVKNSEDYHNRVTNYAAFSALNRATWIAVSAAGDDVNHAVSAGLLNHPW